MRSLGLATRFKRYFKVLIEVEASRLCMIGQRLQLEHAQENYECPLLYHDFDIPKESDPTKKLLEVQSVNWQVPGHNLLPDVNLSAFLTWYQSFMLPILALQTLLPNIPEIEALLDAREAANARPPPLNDDDSDEEESLEQIEARELAEMKWALTYVQQHTPEGGTDLIVPDEWIFGAAQDDDLVGFLNYIYRGSEHVDIYCKDEDGYTLLMTACAHGSTQVARVLLHLEVAQVDHVAPDGQTALVLAIVEGYDAIVKALMDQPGARDVVGFDHADTEEEQREIRVADAYLLCVCATRNFVETLRVLVEHPRYISCSNVKDQFGRTALCCAAAEGDIAVARHLCNIPDFDINQLGLYTRVVRDLENKEKRPNLREIPATPLQIAVRHNFIKLAKLLLKHGADPNIRNENNSSSCMLEATANGNFEMMELLLQHKAKLGAKGESGNTEAMLAAFLGDYAAVQLLMAHGASTEATNNAGETVTDIVQNLHRRRLEEVLEMDLDAMGCATSPAIQAEASDKFDAQAALAKAAREQRGEKERRAQPVMNSAQLAQVLMDLGIHTQYGFRFQQLVSFIFRSTDRNGDGGIQKEEFVACYHRYLWIRKLSKSDDEIDILVS